MTILKTAIFLKVALQEYMAVFEYTMSVSSSTQEISILNYTVYVKSDVTGSYVPTAYKFNEQGLEDIKNSLYMDWEYNRMYQAEQKDKFFQDQE